eukprot:TRINITY_DN7777_c2_g1_i1.p1 TRINITY_DN7777_c2_g1~~TRINITY_DN7777_c2_g1_i1.p1  ORF type:complete len:297 (+),score=128.70 TRINITY_DN7777_c2_g1_i1:67-891(+)
MAASAAHYGARMHSAVADFSRSLPAPNVVPECRRRTHTVVAVDEPDVVGPAECGQWCLAAGRAMAARKPDVWAWLLRTMPACEAAQALEVAVLQTCATVGDVLPLLSGVMLSADSTAAAAVAELLAALQLPPHLQVEAAAVVVAAMSAAGASDSATAAAVHRAAARIGPDMRVRMWQRASAVARACGRDWLAQRLWHVPEPPPPPTDARGTEEPLAAQAEQEAAAAAAAVACLQQQQQQKEQQQQQPPPPPPPPLQPTADELRDPRSTPPDAEV